MIPELPAFPSSYAKRTGLAGSSNLPQPWLDYMRGFHGRTTFCRGLCSSREDRSAIGDICNRQPSVASMKSNRLRWSPCAGTEPTASVLRIHGRSIGEPGLLVPGNAELLTVSCGQGRKSELVFSIPGETCVAAFHDVTMPGRGSGMAMCGLLGYSTGYVLASILRHSRAIGGEYDVPWSPLYDADIPYVDACRRGSVCRLRIAEPLSTIAEQLFLGKLPNVLLGLDSGFWLGFSARLTESEMTIADPAKAASVMTALARSGYGHAVAKVYGSHTRIRIPEYRRFRKVHVERIRLPLTIEAPLTDAVCVHMLGLLFRLPRL